MKKNLAIILLLCLSTLVVYRHSFSTFFAQDDFILINQFSQNSLWQDLKNAFGPPAVSHWRPMHNIYFFISGNLFGKNYIGYHLLTMIIQVVAGFFVHKTVNLLIKNWWVSAGSATLYVSHPAHFVSLFWISGGATLIGFSLLIISFYLYLKNAKKLALFFFIASVLASEAMLFGISLFWIYELFKKRKSPPTYFLTALTSVTIIFAIIKIFLLTPKSTSASYPLEISTQTISAIKYYLLRTFGFAGVAGDNLTNSLLLIWWTTIGWVLYHGRKRIRIADLAMATAFTSVGLFPFILLPKNLSAHYMNIAIFGLVLLIAHILKRASFSVPIIIFLVFLLVAALNINLIKRTHWVVTRAAIAKMYLEAIEKQNLPAASQINFSDNQISTSEEAYIALGTGKAIDFWFRDKNYKYCFTRFDVC